MTNYCSNCGAPLAQDMTRCSSCGAPLASSVMSPLPYGETPYMESAPSSFAAAPTETPYVESAPFSAAASFASAPTASGLPTMLAAPGGVYPPPYSQPLPPGAPPLYPARPPAPLRRRFPVALIALICVLVVAVVVGSALTYYALSRHGASSPTASKASPTATPTPHKTPLDTSNPQALYTQVMGRTPTVNGALSNQNLYQWLAEPNNADCTPEGAGLRVTMKNGQAAFCLAQNTSYSNFAFQIQATINQGFIGGIIFRTDILGRKVYFLGIANQGGVYEIASVTSTSGGQVNPKLLGGGVSTAIKAGLGQPNIITVIAIGSTLNFYVNRQFVSTVQDSSSASGAIGLLGANAGQGNIDISFANAMIWNLTQ
jgi:hypothetical protein